MNANRTTILGSIASRAAAPVGVFAIVDTLSQWWRGGWWRPCPPAAPFADVAVSGSGSSW